MAPENRSSMAIPKGKDCLPIILFKGKKIGFREGNLSNIFGMYSFGEVYEMLKHDCSFSCTFHGHLL